MFKDDKRLTLFTGSVEQHYRSAGIFILIDRSWHQLSKPGHGIGTEGSSVFSEDHETTSGLTLRYTTAPSLLRTHGSIEVDATIQVGIRPRHSRASIAAGRAARAAISIAHLHQESMEIILHQLSIPGHGIGTEGDSVFSEDHD